MANKFNLNKRFAIALTILGALSAGAHAAVDTVAVARVDFSIGDVTSTPPSGAMRTLSKGSEVSVGELINTNNGRAQLRFTDGAFMSLQPRTEFRVDNYKFDGKNDGSERGFFSLLSGGIRVITGLVGRGDRDNYKLNTATGVLGVRGTEYSVTYGNSITVTVGTGGINFCNAGGCVSAASGQTLYIADANTTPVIIQIKTDLPTTPLDPTLQTFKKIDDRAPGGAVAGLTLPRIEPPEPKLQPGTTMPLNLAFAHNPDPIAFKPGDSHAIVPTLVTLDAELRMRAFLDTAPPIPGPVTWLGAFDTTGASGNDGIIAWNRWVAPGTTLPIALGGSHGNLNMSDQDSLHYVIGVPTPQSDMLALSIANVTATYDLLGATRPTSRGGGNPSSTIGELSSGNLFVNFGTSQVTATLVVQTVVSTYNVVGTNLPIVSSGFSSALAPGSVTVSPVVPNTACSNVCSGTIDGFFAGAKASRAGVAYSFTDAAAESQTAGAAAFKRRGF